jgi:signal transduction histidine kinase
MTPDADMHAVIRHLAHQLNNPLASIIGFTELILENADALEAQVRTDVEKIHHEAIRMRDILYTAQRSIETGTATDT